MSITQMLFSFQGRMRRRDYWLCGIGLAIVSWVLSSIGQAVAGVSMLSLFSRSGQTAANLGDTVLKVVCIQAGVNLLLLWPSLAINVKRLHDRDRPGWIIAIFYVVVIIQQYFSFTRMAQGGMFSPPSMMGLVSLLALIVVGLWLFIDLGLLDGAQGSNKYGPSPKGAMSEADLAAAT
jgi:uncharacterized membrane protein YhaH (DUF805 family)